MKEVISDSKVELTVRIFFLLLMFLVFLQQQIMPTHTTHHIKKKNKKCTLALLFMLSHDTRQNLQFFSGLFVLRPLFFLRLLNGIFLNQLPSWAIIFYYFVCPMLCATKQNVLFENVDLFFVFWLVWVWKG